MGAWIQFTCENCGYRAEVSGGKDFGMVAVVQTMVCHSCNQLVDVLIGRYGTEGPTGDPDYDKGLGVCSGCHGNDVVAWEETRPCPKCDGRMIEGQTTALWD